VHSFDALLFEWVKIVEVSAISLSNLHARKSGHPHLIETKILSLDLNSLCLKFFGAGKLSFRVFV
jgi:hypothetical protein